MNSFVSEAKLRERLKEARYLEFCADIEQARAVLSPILKTLSDNPNHFSTELSCEVMLVYGSVISYDGMTKKEKYLQETAMDFLTEARRLAFESDDRDLIAEAEKQIGLCYWRIGQHDNAAAYFNTVLERYTPEEQRTKTVCLSAQSNLIGVNLDLQKTKAAKNLLEKIAPFIEVSEDRWLQTLFYAEAAGVYLRLGALDSAIPFLERAAEFSRLTKNESFLADVLNNLALVHLERNDVKEARRHIESAVEIFAKLSQKFAFGMALETKAQILIAENEWTQARFVIEESIAILEKSENYHALAESLWTSVRIAAHDGDKTAALSEFARLTNVIKNRLSETHIKSYTEKFSEIFYLDQGGDFYEKSENFRRHLLDRALSTSGASVTRTAKTLGISHQNTSLLLKKYPDLCEKHGIKLRRRATDAFLAKNNRVKKTSIDSFAIRLASDRLAYLGLSKGKIINVRLCPLDELDLSKPVVIKDKDKKHNCGFLVNDFGMFAFEDGRGNLERTFMPADIIESGQVTGVYDDEAEGFISLQWESRN